MQRDALAVAADQRRRHLQPASMRSIVFEWRNAVTAPDSGLTSTQRLIALVLSLHMNTDGYCRPSVPTIARRAGLKDPRSVRLALPVLEDAGWLRIDRGGANGKETNHYYALLAARARDRGRQVRRAHRDRGPQLGRGVAEPRRRRRDGGGDRRPGRRCRAPARRPRGVAGAGQERAEAAPLVPGHRRAADVVPGRHPPPRLSHLRSAHGLTT
jgi:hypothetical protein